jgi:hypothetical protein
MNTLHGFDIETVSIVSRKQEKAIALAAQSDRNSLGLTCEDVGIVVRSKPPLNLVGSMVTFLTAEHRVLWTHMRDSSLDALVEDFLKQINNRRVVQAVLGDD